MDSHSHSCAVVSTQVALPHGSEIRTRRDSCRGQVNKAEAEFWRRSQGTRVDYSDKILGFECGGQQWVNEVSFPVGTLEEPNGKDLDYMVSGGMGTSHGSVNLSAATVRCMRDNADRAEKHARVVASPTYHNVCHYVVVGSVSVAS